MPNLAARTLQEWNGQSWISHSVPRAYVLNRLSHLSVDARGRVWPLPDFRDEKAAFFDVKTGSWRVFPSLQKALQEELKQFGWRAAENLKIGDGSEYSKPRFAAPGRIVFRSESEKIVAFDGKIWRSWTRKQIKRDSSPGETSFDDAPSFSESGNLRINIEGQIWEWTPDAGWQASDEAAETNPNEGLDLVAPKGGPASRPESIARDDSGAIWITFERQLYKAAFGLWAPQLSPRERHPFQDGRSIKAVLRDSRGNLFLETGYSGEETVILPPRAPLPTTRIAVRKTAVDRAEFAFSTTATGKHWFRWRLDGGAWSAVSTRSVMQLRDLPGGEHKLEAQTIDRFLQTDLSPAKASFRVNIQATQQIESFIAALRSPDYAEREAAVVALSRQPQSALPALRRAQERSLVQSPDNTDERWWLDAAIQRIENAR